MEMLKYFGSVNLLGTAKDSVGVIFHIWIYYRQLLAPCRESCGLPNANSFSGRKQKQAFELGRAFRSEEPWYSFPSHPENSGKFREHWSGDRKSRQHFLAKAHEVGQGRPIRIGEGIEVEIWKALQVGRETVIGGVKIGSLFPLQKGIEISQVEIGMGPCSGIIMI